MFNIEFYRGKKILITGHTGFKGAWLCKILISTGAQVIGYALDPPQGITSLFDIAEISKNMKSVIGDIRDYEHLKKVFDEAEPEIVIHMAAQPLVLESYANPAYTYETNVMGTVNILECIRMSDCVKSFLNVTTDKVYKEGVTEHGYHEDEYLDGYDPYSNSKSCSELVTHCYKRSFFQEGSVAISTARAGNVIGGGDFAKGRILSDCLFAVKNKEDIIVKNPLSIRPYQHVLEPIYAYLMIAAMQYQDSKYAGWYNVGPDEEDCYRTGTLVDIFLEKWGGGIKRVDHSSSGPHESKTLKLDCSKLKSTFGWKPRWNLYMAVDMVVEWSKCWITGEDVSTVMEKQIERFLQTE